VTSAPPLTILNASPSKYVGRYSAIIFAELSDTSDGFKTTALPAANAAMSGAKQSCTGKSVKSTTGRRAAPGEGWGGTPRRDDEDDAERLRDEACGARLLHEGEGLAARAHPRGEAACGMLRLAVDEGYLGEVGFAGRLAEVGC
jgi:hypothetical protein